MKFNLTISDEQREMIIAALGAYAYPACFEPSDREELDLLVVMLHTAEPGEVINDLTL